MKLIIIKGNIKVRVVFNEVGKERECKEIIEKLKRLNKEVILHPNF